MSKYFKSLRRAKPVKAVFPTPEPTPRELSVIQKEASELFGKAGQAQYHLYVYTQELERLNSLLFNVNNEAAARQKLLNEAKQELGKEAKEEVINE